ncbi:AI-2E family transporter [Desulfovibrio mangrovi]|uniref:AI-2E family transporter n=1 Tax=Desulfovibrio mangrovi TaxID=2976983 RepID=UPI002246BC8D|nr:AI-2E family transporter [Desulfovibrio mangrovi]UZP67423.1 AI-2E family transporter [Desulfovibrio mangrovi]
MVISDKPFTFDRVVRIAITIGLLWGGVTVLGYLSDVLVPFVVALILAYLMHPLAQRIQTYVKRREVAVLLTLLLIISVLCGLISLIVPMITAEVKHMGRLVTEFAGNSPLAAKASQELPAEVWAVLKDVLNQSDLREFFTSSQGLDMVQTAAKKLLPGLWGAVKGAGNLIMGIMGLLIIVLYTVFLLMDFQKVQTDWRTMLPLSWRAPVELFVNDFEAGMNRYFRAQALVAAIVGVLFAIGFSILGLPLAILLGLFIGALNMVPYLQILGFVPAVLLGIIHWLETDINFAMLMLLILAVFAVVQLIQDAVLTPRIMGQAMGLSPWMILLSLSVWGKLLGLLGLLIALPMTVLCLSYYRRVIDPVPAVRVEDLSPDDSPEEQAKED